MLQENPHISLEQLADLKYSTRMELADQVLDARQSGDATAKRAAEVLATWDQQALPTSTGTLLFVSWVQAVGPRGGERLFGLFSTRWDPADPLTMPSGLADPD